MTGSINAYDRCAGGEPKTTKLAHRRLRWSALTVEALALAELELLTSARLTVFTLDHTSVSVRCPAS